MAQESVTVAVQMTAERFRDFAIYDTLVRQRRWVPPAVFCAILCASAAVCFALRGRSSGAGVLVGVLLAVGIGLPAAYFLSFFLSIRQQIRRLGLTAPKAAYTVVLDGAGVCVTAGAEHLTHRWDELYRVIFRPKAAYLYPSPTKAYLLPYGDCDAALLRSHLQEHLPADKLFGL